MPLESSLSSALPRMTSVSQRMAPPTKMGKVVEMGR